MAAGPRAVALLIVAAVLAGAGPAAAVSRKVEVKDIVIFVDSSGEAGDLRRAKRFLQRKGIDAQAVELEHGVDRLMGGSEIGVYGEARAEICTGTALHETEFTATLQSVEELFDFAEYAQATDALESLRTRLPCLVDPIDNRRLHRLHLLEGVALWFLGERSAAREAFTRAVSTNDAYEWGSEFGPGAQEAYVEAERSVFREGKAHLTLVWSGNDTAASVDGRAVELDQGFAEVEVWTGTHLLHVVPANGDPYVRVLDLPSDTAVVQRQGMVEGLCFLGFEQTRRPNDALLTALCGWLRDNGYEGGWLVLDEGAGGSPEAPADGKRAAASLRLMRIDPGRVELRRPDIVGDRLQNYPWWFRAQFATGMLAIIEQGEFLPFAKIEQSLVFPALPYLGIGVSVGVASRRGGAGEKTPFLVPIRTHLRVAPEYGPIRPFADLSLAMIWMGDREPVEFTLGFELIGGIDIRPFRNPRTGFHIGGGGGYFTEAPADFQGGWLLDIEVGISLQW